MSYTINKAKQAYYTNFISENTESQAKLFRSAKSLLTPKEDLYFPNYSNKDMHCNDIGEFFVQKITRIRRERDAAILSEDIRALLPDDQVLPDSYTTLDHFKQLSEDEVRTLVSSASKKHCALDPMPSSLVSDCLDVLLPVITKIINSSLVHGYFLQDWKEALVKPLLKKSVLVADFNNLRPISSLKFISKLTERTVYNQTYDHVMANDLLSKLQSAYGKRYSTKTAVLKIYNDILLSMNKQHVTLLVLLDLSPAFDIVDNSILLERTTKSFGISGKALEWLSSYLSGRSQRVTLDGGVSMEFMTTCGVPQRSCLGPLLSTLYSSKLFTIIEKYIPCVLEHDTQQYLSFNPGCTATEEESIAPMENCIKAIRAWMIIDKMKINDIKTEYLIIGTKQQLNKVNIRTLSVGDSAVAPAAMARNLGVLFDENLTLLPRINNTCKAAFYYIHNIRRIRKYLSVETTRTLVHTVVIGRLDYCNIKYAT